MQVAVQVFVFSPYPAISPSTSSYSLLCACVAKMSAKISAQLQAVLAKTAEGTINRSGSRTVAFSVCDSICQTVSLEVKTWHGTRGILVLMLKLPETPSMRDLVYEI